MRDLDFAQASDLRAKGGSASMGKCGEFEWREGWNTRNMRKVGRGRMGGERRGDFDDGEKQRGGTTGKGMKGGGCLEGH